MSSLPHKLYTAKIDTEPSYKICWYHNQPRNLNKLNARVDQDKKIRIGDYCERYRGFFQEQAVDDFMIDIGANIGLSAFPVGSIGHRVICFEPVAVNIELLRAGIKANHFQDLVTIAEIAVSDADEWVTIYVPDWRADNASLDKTCSNLNLQANPARGSQIQTLKFDSWWQQQNGEYKIQDARLFKVDTQGHEYSVIQGAQIFLREATQWQKLILEIEWDSGFISQRGIDGVELLLNLDNLGYEVYDPVPLMPNDFSEFVAQQRRCDLLCRVKKNTNN